MLCENAALNGFVIDARMVGLSDSPGNATLHVAKDSNAGAGTLLDVGGDGVAITLDTLERQLSETPAVMKIDIEGSENILKELAGGKEELFEIMSERGYEVRIVSPVRRSNAVSDTIYFQYDAVFTKT
jgi:hypothetical protein